MKIDLTGATKWIGKPNMTPLSILELSINPINLMDMDEQFLIMEDLCMRANFKMGYSMDIRDSTRLLNPTLL